MKNVNLIEMLRGCSKRNGMAVSASNPDGQPTVNRRSRLMSHRGYLKNLAMIFAVLVMSVANIGMAWGATKTITFSGPTSTCSAGNNITLSATTNITESVTLSTGISFTNSGYALSATTGDNKSCTYSSTSYKIPQLYTTGGTKANWNLAGAISQYVDITLPAGSSFTLSSIAWALDAQSTAFTAYIGVSGGLISYKSTGLSVSNSTSASTGTLSSLNQSWVGGTTYRLYVETTGPSNTGKYFGICKLVLTGEYSAPVASEWQVKGLDDGTWAGFNMTGTGTVTCSRSLSANKQYEFKLYNTSTSKWWGNGTTYRMTQGQTIVQADAGANCKLRTSKAGTYTFSFNTSTNELTVTYPDDYKGYWTKNGASWSKVYAYCYNDGTWKNADWPGVEITDQTEDICGTHYYINTSGYTTVIFNNGSSGTGNQTGDITISGGDGKHAVGAAATAFEAFPTYTVTYNKNGDGAGGAGSVTGSVPTDSNSPYACGSTVTVLGNTGSLALDGYTFAGWNTAPGGGGTSYAADATFTISANTTLYAQWELIPTYDVIYNTNGGTGGSTASQTGNLSGAQVTTSANGFTKTGYKFKWWNTAANGSGEDFYPGEKVTIASANVNLYAQWEEVASGWAYWVGDVNVSSTTTDITGNGVTMRFTNSGGAWNTDVSQDKNRVSKYNGTTDKHAKVLAIDDDNEYLQVHFTDGKPINTLKLGVVNTDASTANAMVVLYSTTADFSSGEYEKVTHNSPGYTQATKSMTDFSPSTENKYYYARIYRKISTAVYEQTGGSSKTIRIYAVKAQKGATCTAPSTVTVAPTNANGYRYTPGETISLTCTASGGSGGDYSYQWQKYNGSAWEDIDDATSAVYSKANCTTSDGGSYRCKVSTGEDCTTISDGGDGYKIRVWTFNGNYNDEGFIANNITWTGANTGTVTLTLNANSTYKFKVYDNDGKYFGCNSGITADVSNWTFRTNESNCSLTTGKVAGEYTFTIDITNVGDNNISVSVVYPKMRIYMVCGGTWCDADPAFFVHSWKSSTTNDAKMIAHPCEDGVYYADLPSFVTDMTILRLKTGTESVVWEGNANFLNRSSNITIGSNDKFTFSSWNTGVSPSQGTFTAGTYSPTTYTVSAAASTAGYGTVSAASVTGVACGTSISASSNTLTVGETNVTAAAASATAEYTYAFDNWTWTPAGATVTSDVTATANFTRTPKSYTLTWNLAGGKVTVAGTGAAVNATGTPNSEVAFGTAITAPTVTKTGYTFAGWSSDVASTMPAANTTYTATWSSTAPTISAQPSDVSCNVGDVRSISVTASISTGGTPTYQWQVSDDGSSGWENVASDGTSASYTVPTASAGTKYYRCVVTNPNGSATTTSDAATVTVTAAAVLTALVANTLYEVPNMIPSGASLTSSDQFMAGLSENTKFEMIGVPASSSTPKVNNDTKNDKTIDGITFDDGSMWFKGEASLTSNIPTTFGLSFIVPEGGGKLYLYFSGTSTNIKLAKSGASGSKPSCASGYGEVDVTAGTYYLYGTGTTSPYSFYGLKLCSKYNVSISTTNVTKTDGATGAGAAIHGRAYTATFTAPVGYTLPSDVTSLTIGGTPQTKGTDYTWTISDGTATLTIPAAKVTGNIVVSVAGAAASTYSITYHCNGAESGCPSNVAATTNLPSPLPTGLTKDGYDFGGWFTDSECTVAAVAGAELTCNTDLYAKWTERGSECEDTPHAWNVVATSAKSYKVRISKVTEEVAIPVADATASNLTAYAGSVSTNDNVTVQIADGGSSKYGYKFDRSNTYLKLVFSTPLVLNDTLVVGMTDASKNISFTTTAVRSTTLSTSGGKLIIPAALAGQSTLYLWRGSGNTMYLRSFAVKHECEAIPSCTTPVIPALSNQTVCEGSDIVAWDATPTNASAITAAGQSIAYSWKKKGNDTELEDNATFDLGASATESQAGTYVVTVTVSKAGYASASASKEVTLTVTPTMEEPSVTQSPAKVYTSGSVTLTATCGSEGAKTWQWYTCTNAAGDGESILSGKNSAEYAFTAPASAGTYYYKVKVTGDGTNACGTASHVYALSVNAATGGDCTTYYWFANADDATTNSVTQNESSFFSGAKSGTNNNSTTITVDETELTITKRISASAETVTFTVPSEKTATLYVNAKANSSSKPLILVRTATSDTIVVTTSTTLANYSAENITAGAWKLTCGSGNNWYYGAIIVKVCSAGSCTDAEPVATATNTTVCSGTALTITATNYETSPTTIQWQKKNGSSWDNISGATTATYTVASAAAEHAGTYRVQVTKGCVRNSNEVTITVPSAPVFGAVPASVSVMQTEALSITTVEATDAAKYRWYKSTDATWDAGDVEIGTNKELIKAYDSEAIGSPSYYILCRAQNACGITTSSAIAVNVTAYVEEDCATRGNEGDAAFGFEYSAGQATYSSTACWSMNDNSKKLIYAAPEGKYFKTMKVTIASSSASKASYNWSTNGGTTFTEVAINSINTTLTEKTIDVSAHGNVNALQIGRNLGGNGESSGTLYVSKICFEYTDACTATTVTPSTASTSYEMGGAWSNPTFTLTPAAVSGETLTYSSSNEDIASVDDDGTVTFNGDAGTVTITASYAGGTISATDYCASSGSYTITVSCTGGAPKVVASGTTVGCSSSITLQAKKQDDTAFADGTYQWFRNGEEIDGATSSSYTATQAGTYTVARTNGTGCTTPSTNSAIVTSETTEPEVERLVPFQYYHVNKTYSDQMKMRHLFAVKNSGTLDGKHFKMYVSRNGGVATDVTSSNALVVWPNADGHVDTVMVDLNKLSGKYSEDDELVFTCKAIDCSGNVSDVYKETITMNVIGATPTLALICSGSSKAGGTRKTGELTVGGDFLTGYNVADLCQQTGNTSFDANTEWGLYTRLKENYIVTPVNGYAVFNKLNYEPFDILLLTDYPKASKSDAAAAVLDDMADLCDYRPMLSFKAHMVAKTPSKWAAKGFTTSPVVPKNTRTRLNIVCYAHPMFAGMKETATHIQNDYDDPSQIVYTMLTGPGYEGSKGLQGFELEAAENFVTIGLVHYNASPADATPSEGLVTWTPGSGDRMLVTAVERQKNPEARMIMFAVNCGAQSKFTETGRDVVLKCLEYLLTDHTITPMADCSFTFDNGAGNSRNAAKQAEDCPSCTGTKGDGKWSTAANWGPDYVVRPGKDTEVKIAAPVEVDMTHAIARSARIVEGGHITIPAGKALEIVGTIRRLDGTEISPTEENDIHIGSSETGNGTLIFNNNTGDTKARVDMYSNAKADVENMSAATSTWQYIGTPHNDVASATRNYYNSWLYQYSGSGWEVIPNGGPLVPFRGYCVTHPDAPVVFDMEGTLVATTAQNIAIPAGYTVIANSWTAPIDINAITDDDMENISDKTIYFFNTGSDADGNHGTGTAAGTYRATPIHSASYTGDWQIPSMQGFYISTTSAGTLHLDYERHVRPTGSRSVVSNRMYAPRRAAAESDEPNVLKIFARGSRYQDKLVVLEREDFTRGYDSGWDGEAWGGSNLSPMVYVTGEGREDAVSAIPEFEGTVVAFKAGEDNEYTIDFEYNSEEPLYLLDTENNTYTQIMTGNAYYFTTTDKAAHSRFILTRKAPQIATGVGEVPSDQVLSTKAKKLLIEDKMYILLNGMLYDATGKVVFK